MEDYFVSTLEKAPNQMDAGASARPIVCGNKRKICRICLAMLISAVLVAFAWYKTGIYFETNDDRYIASFLSGMMTGQPEAHTIYVNYLLTFPLSLLYRLTTAVPWYGGMMVLFHWLLYGVILDSAYTRCRGPLQMLSATAVLAGFFTAYFYCIGFLEFTSTAGLLAAGGYACLLLRRDRRTGFAWFLVFELLGCLMRSEAMLMLQPLGLAAVFVILVGNRDAGWKEKGKSFLAVVLGMLLVLCVDKAGDFIGYHGDEWAPYFRFNRTQTLLFDYYNVPEYEEIESLLEEYGISREKYGAYREYMLLDWKVDAALEEGLSAYAEEKARKPLRIPELLGQIYEASFKSPQWGAEYVTMAAWCLFLLWMLINRRFNMLLYGVVLIGGARTAVWGYLVWMGRLPIRVTFPLLACEVLLLLALTWHDYGKEEVFSLRRNTIFLLGGAVFCVAGVVSGGMQMEYVGELNASQKIYIKGLEEFQDYCDHRPENRYVIDGNAQGHYRGSAFETSVYHPVNAVYAGGWYSVSPPVQQRLEEYLADAPGFYFVVYMDGNQENMPQYAYLTQVMGAEPVLAEEWTASHGGVYGLYYFQGAFPFS